MIADEKFPVTKDDGIRKIGLMGVVYFENIALPEDYGLNSEIEWQESRWLQTLSGRLEGLYVSMEAERVLIFQSSLLHQT